MAARGLVSRMSASRTRLGRSRSSRGGRGTSSSRCSGTRVSAAYARFRGVAKLLDVGALIFYDLTKLGRDLFDVIDTYRMLLGEGFTVLFVKHSELNARPETPLGEALRKAILALLSIAAEIERASIRKRIRVGMRRAKEEGKHVGRPPYPLPLEKVRQLLSQGKTIADAWRLLRETGEICRTTGDGKRQCMSYETFRRKVKEVLGKVRA